MKICLSWLNEYLPGPLDADVLADALTRAGLPVESIEKTEAGETVLDVEVTSNRSDCLSYLGIAHELAAMLDRPFRDVLPKEVEFAATPTAPVAVSIAAPELCPHYIARVIENIVIRPSPPWLAHRLEAMGLRPINNIVDVTNYVLFEMGQPLHAFDFAAVHGKKIIVRQAAAGESLVTLDGKERKLEPHMLTIADADRPLALAGVMGGRDSEVTDATRSILLESARFQPLSIRKTSRQLAMRSDSSYRFERGIDPTLPLRASRRAIELFLQTAGGNVIGDLVEAGASGYSPKTLHLRLPTLRRVLGVEFPTEQVIDALRRLRLNPRQQDGQIAVDIPSDRLDLNSEIDLVEEVARMIGYDKIPERDTIRIRLTPRDPKEAALSEIRSVLAAAGYYESLTMTFVSDALAGDFAPLETKWDGKLLRADPSVRKADASLRPSILPGLLESVRRNHANGTPLAKLFEIGSTFWEAPGEGGGEAREERTVALVGSPDLREVRGAVEALLRRLNPTSSMRIIPAEHRAFAANAAGRIEWNGKPIGVIGVLGDAVAGKLSLRQPPAAAELRLADLLAGAVAVPTLSPLPRFPAVRRDLSLIVAESVRHEQIESLARSLNLPHLEDIEYVVTYRGKPLEKNTKSVTITLVFRSPTETLTSEQVEDAVARMTTAAGSALSAILRV
jgi:phenylalanyl-tRNA synthetase beta chain